jgi:hypothetical protein
MSKESGNLGVLGLYKRVMGAMKRRERNGVVV